jgi:hypothetical protein
MITETELAAIEEQANKGGTINPDDLASLIEAVRKRDRQILWLESLFAAIGYVIQRPIPEAVETEKGGE